MLDPCVSVPCDARCCDAAEVPLLETDIDRLRTHTGRSEEDFVEATPDGWKVLRGTGLDGCVFRGEVQVGDRRVTGCQVHTARPEACRLYPFVLRTAPDGSPRTDLDPFCPYAGAFVEPEGAAATLADLERRLEADLERRLEADLERRLEMERRERGA